jgi:amino acid adenylation domain-containing protein
MFVPLCRGGKIIMAENALALPFLPAAEQVTLINTVPSAMAELLRMEGVPQRARVVNLAGEPLQRKLVQQIYELPTVSKVYNLYGPTEDTTYSTFTLVAKEDQRAPSIGRPIANSYVYLLNADLELVPQGEPGELHIAGAGLARGYLLRPDMTAEKFIPDPFAAGARLYRTGDLARWCEDGELEFMGRLDHQVKIRGHRIELGEIESVLADYPGVEAVAVIGREDTPGDQRLVAYLVAQEPAPLVVEKLREYLGGRLPDFMLPNAFVALKALPLTPNGKLDRAALPPPDSRLQTSTPFTPPRTPTQEMLAEIWRPILKLPAVGIRDDFFASGGHSLVGIQMLSRVRATFGVDISLARLFEISTLESMAAFIDQARSRTDRVLSRPIEKSPRPARIPCSFAQSGLWFFDKLSGANACYNIPAGFMVSGELDLSALQRSLNWMAERHDSLRTVFSDAGDGAVQSILPELRLTVPVADLSGLPPALSHERLKELAEAEARRPFDLSRGPLLRLSLIRLSGQLHLLLLVVHHIIWDDWSARVFYREFAAAYDRFAKNDETAPTPAPLQYADFVVWRQDRLRGAVLEEQREYWLRRLDGIPEQSPLPTDYSRPPVERYLGDIRELEIPAGCASRAKALAQHEGVTLAILTLAVFKAVLHRYSGGDDMVVGWAVANRTRIELEEMIGLFVDTQVIRTDLSQDPAFRALLKRVRQSCMGAYEHSEMPFEMLVRELNPSRNAGQNPIVQVLFTFQNTLGLVPDLPGLQVHPFVIHTGTSKMDLCFNVWEEADGFRCRLEYNTDLFSGGTMERLARHFRTVMEGIVSNPEVRLSQLPLLSEVERRQLLVDWQSSVQDNALWTSGPMCIHQLFEEQVERTPKNAAVAFEGSQLTYSELERRTNQLARYLRKAGVGPETLVGVCMERSIEMVVGLLGILKAGGAYVPLDPGYPKERLAYMLENSQAKMVLTQEHLNENLSLQQTTAVRLDRDWERIARESGNRPEFQVWPENLAYVLYTSGSTGKPKGVGISHRALVNHMHWRKEEFGFEEKDRFLQKTPINFDASVWEFYAPLFNGGCLEVLKPEGHREPKHLGEKIVQAGITVVQMVPSLLEATLEAGGLRRGSNLRLVMCGGEVFRTDLAEKVWTGLGVEVVNLYGPTETTIDASYWRGWNWTEGQGLPIGRPIANTTVYILDRAFQLVPAGMPGEIYVGGEALGRGYIHRPGLTAEKFVPNPFSEQPGERLYRTGDRGRYRADGNIEYLGRFDHQIKIRGFRVELGEIESVLSGHDAIAESVVIARREEPAGYRLVAFVVPRTGITLESKVLREFLAGWLPSHAVPSAFVFLDALPRTPHGKVNRNALQEPGATEPDWSSFAAPKTLAEKLLARVWRVVLRVEHIDIHDVFFDLGGHSLLATRVIARLVDMLRIDVPLRLMFESPTIAQLAVKLEHLLAAQIDSSHPGATPESRQALLEQRLLRLDAGAQIPRRSGAGPAVLSFVQQHFWLLEQLNPGNSFHHSGMGIHLEGPIDAGFLEASLREILSRHEALRTVFPAYMGEPQQLIQQIESWKMRTVDLTALSGAVRQREVECLITQESNRCFDLEHGPLFRAILLRRGPRDHSLLLVMHHIVFDGWSGGIMLEELAALYECFLSGRKPALPALPIQYADFSEWQRGWLQGEVLESQLSYWRSQLADLRTVELPFDCPRREVSSHHGRQLSFSVSRKTSAALASLGREQGSTLFVTLLAAFKALLTRYTGAPEQLIGTAVAGRTRPETEGLIGAFTNTLVLRTNLEGDPAFIELLHRVHEVAMDAHARQDVPFELLVEKLQPERTLNVNPYFQIMFAQGTVAPVEKLGAATMRPFPLECHGSVLDLFAQVREAPTGLKGELIYDMDLFDQVTAIRLLNCFETLLDSIIAHPHRRISELEILGPSMRHQVLLEWNDTFSPAEEPLLHRRFEDQAARTPDAIALIDGEERMTYAELRRQARVLGSRLRSLKAGPEFLVAILMERTTEMVVAILGVLSAGGGYVPLDPAYPRDRLAYMLEDSGARVLLTQSHLREFLPPHQTELVVLDHGREMGGEDGSVETVPGNVAYVLYTSGSTGRPKGVAIQHSSASKFVRWSLSAFEPAELAGVLASTSLCFDLSVFEIYVPLSCGGTVILARNALALPELPAANLVTLINTVPSAMVELVALNRIPASVRTVNLCGEALHRSLADGIYARSAATRVVNFYGPTESTTYSTYIDVPRVAAVEPPIGRPLEGTQVYLLDAHLAPVPPGAVGDLYLGGAGLARGYAGLPHVTAEKFVPNSFADPPGSRLYATGDIARFQSNGDLEFLGRRDHQIKLRGFRIELGEIECALLRHEAVAEAVVTARREDPGGMRLVAYAVPRAGLHLEADQLREFLSAWLPAHAVPSAFVLLDALPRTPNGKINRNALPAPEAAQADDSSFIEPSTSAELLLAQIWRDVLKIERIGIHDHFFHLGGHSLMATRVIARLREALQLEVPLRSIFETPTIARLSRKLEHLLEEQIAASSDPAVATSIKLQEQS